MSLSVYLSTYISISIYPCVYLSNPSKLPSIYPYSGMLSLYREADRCTRLTARCLFAVADKSESDPAAPARTNASALYRVSARADAGRIE